MQIVFWLEPADRDRAYYQAIIDELSEKYDAAKFAAHITLYVDEYNPNLDLSTLLEVVTQNVSPINLTIDGVYYSELFTKTLFIQFQSDSRLDQLFESVRDYSGSPSGYVLNPHLSLIYSRSLTESQKRELASAIVLRDQIVRFDQISVLTSSNKVETREDIEAAKVIYRKPLGLNN